MSDNGNEIKIGKEDAAWLTRLNQATDRAAFARISFVEYLYAKHGVSGEEFNFRMDIMAFEKKQNP